MIPHQGSFCYENDPPMEDIRENNLSLKYCLYHNENQRAIEESSFSLYLIKILIYINILKYLKDMHIYIIDSV